MIEIQCRLVTILALLSFSHCSSIYQRPFSLKDWTNYHVQLPFYYPAVPYPLMVATSMMSNTSAQIEKAVATSTKISCGVGPAKILSLDEDRIVGGTEAVPNSWPGIVVLKVFGEFACGGFLISPNKVLTAAHCVDYAFPWSFLFFTVELGVHVLFPTSDAPVSRKLLRVERHINYDPVTAYNDIAILTLKFPVTYTSKISPVCLPPVGTTDDYANQEAVIIGWGSSSPDGGSLPNALQQATIQTVGNAGCQTSYDDQSTTIQDSMICATASGKSSCFGDSGGPLLVRSSPTAPWTAVGITSFGIECASDVYPIVYTRVSSFSSWIANRI